MVAAACVTLGLIELYIGLSQPPRRARLLFALSAFTVAIISGLELALMRVDVLAAWWPLMRSMDIAVGVLIVSLTAFIWVRFDTGNRWLALAVPVTYAAGLVFDYLPGPLGSGMTYQRITGFRTVETFGGASITVAEGVPTLCNVFPYLAVIILIVFVVDASVKLWRHGGSRQEAVLGCIVAAFFLVAGGQAALVETGFVEMPYMISWIYLAILVAMANGLNADVLASAKLADQLQESERRMDLASAAADLGMWSWDIADDTIWATEQARSMFGISASEHISFAQFQGMLHPEDRGAVDRAIENALTSGCSYESEYRVSLPEGQVRWIAARGQVQHDSRGKPILMRGVVLDISARRDIEMELQQLRSQLAHTGRILIVEQFASALTHELSQPLGAILRNTEAAELFLQREPPDLDELRTVLADIQRDDKRACGVIDGLRALLKRGSFAPRALSVRDELASVETLVRNDAARRKVKLVIDADGDLPLVLGDPVHLQQVLLNLILNGMDAVENVAAARRKVTVSVQRHGEGDIEVAVEDLGVGIAPEKRGQIFEPFFTSKANGMGIGLSISRTIIKAHGGRIWAENNIDEGMTFRFTLPLAGAAKPT